MGARKASQAEPGNRLLQLVGLITLIGLAGILVVPFFIGLLYGLLRPLFSN